MTYEDLGSDGLITCPRCGDRDAREGEICFGCQRELIDFHDHTMGWRKAYELEQDDELRQQIKISPDIIESHRADFERLASEYKDNEDFSKAIAESRARFEERVKRVTKRSNQ
jgi:hypothetical protein